MFKGGWPEKRRPSFTKHIWENTASHEPKQLRTIDYSKNCSNFQLHKSTRLWGGKKDRITFYDLTDQDELRSREAIYYDFIRGCYDPSLASFKKFLDENFREDATSYMQEVTGLSKSGDFTGRGGNKNEVVKKLIIFHEAFDKPTNHNILEHYRIIDCQGDTWTMVGQSSLIPKVVITADLDPYEKKELLKESMEVVIRLTFDDDNKITRFVDYFPPDEGSKRLLLDKIQAG